MLLHRWLVMTVKVNFKSINVLPYTTNNNSYLYSVLFTLCSNVLLKNTVVTLLNAHRSYTEKNESKKKYFEHCNGISPLDISW